MSSPGRAIFLAGHTRQVNKFDVSCQHQIGLQKQKGGLGLWLKYIFTVWSSGCLHSSIWPYKSQSYECHVPLFSTLGKGRWIN